jgi:hypothetical protein
MLGYYKPQEPPKAGVGNKRVKLLIQNLENIVELLKEEFAVEEEEETNVVSFEDMMQKIQDEFEEPEYEEEN